MATQQQVQTSILVGDLRIAELVNTNLTSLSSGGTAKWGYIKRFKRSLNCVTRQYELGDYVSTPFLQAYTCLQGYIGADTSNPINPNAQNPNLIINNSPPYSPITLVRNQGNLIDADPPNGNWYLPFLNDGGLPIVGSVPVSVQVDGESFTFRFDTTFNPARIYGFSNNSTQTIIVTVI